MTLDELRYLCGDGEGYITLVLPPNHHTRSESRDGVTIAIDTHHYATRPTSAQQPR